MDPVTLLDFAGVAVFAATGALAASRKELDAIGFLFLASITGIGGGTVRDLILGVPIFWVADHSYVLVCVAVTVLIHFSAPLIESRYRLCGSTRWGLRPTGFSAPTRGCSLPGLRSSRS